jgi:hypothetical protein
MGVLKVAETKILSGIRVPAFTVAPPAPALSDSLGMASSGESTPTHYSNPALSTLDILRYESKEDYWEACHSLWETTTDKSTLAISVVEAANEYRYLEDLMSEEEATEFETRNV